MKLFRSSNILSIITGILLAFLWACSEEKEKGTGMFDALTKSYVEAEQRPTTISSINLSNQQLKEIPSTLDSRFTKLIQLTLRENEIEEIPRAIGEISTLKSLHVGKNKLTTLPASLKNLSQMGNLTLELNQIDHLPNVAFKYDKSCLVDLRWNKLTSLPEHFSHSTFGHLYLSGNPIKELPENIGMMHNLKTLWLADSEIAEIPESFYELSQLTWLDVRGTNLTREQIEIIKQKLPNCGIQSDFEVAE